MQLVESAAIDPLVGETLALDQAPQALAKLADRSTVGKVVLVPWRRTGAPAGRLRPLRRPLLRRAGLRRLGRLRHRQARRPPCPNLGEDFRCGIHARLRERGFPGCTVYDCFGAGQQSSRSHSAGGPGGRTPALAAAQFALLPVLRQLHEMPLVPGRGARLRARPRARRVRGGAAVSERLVGGPR